MPTHGNKKQSKKRSKKSDPPPSDSDDSSDEEFVPVSVTTRNARSTAKRERKRKGGKKDNERDTEQEDARAEAQIGMILQKILQTYHENEEDDESEEDDIFESEDDDSEDEDYVLVTGGMPFGMQAKKNPYDIRLPPSKLTPELLEYLKEMPNILGKTPKPGEDIESFRGLPKNQQRKIVKAVKEVSRIVNNEVHPYFRILSLPVDAASKRVALERQLMIMNAENSMMSEPNPKAQSWIRGFLDIPFGSYRQPPQRAKKDPVGYLQWAMEVMNKVAFGMDDAKDHILRFVAQMISNPHATGNCLAFLGPPGTGKTSLIRNGLGKILNRPVHMIALGGNTDASVLQGHGYTYEGSVWGQITDILMRSKCMNPVIIFDELDKVSGTSKGDEIIGLLTHITDSTQNTGFQDKYFSGVNIDLSRVLFVFTLNNKDSVNPILMDRLRVIHTAGYSSKEKRIIGEKYLIPGLLKQYAIQSLPISDDGWKWILSERKEDGVRNLKRDLETIISRLNLYSIFSKATDKSTDTIPKGVPKNLQWKEGSNLNETDVRTLLENRNVQRSNIPYGMYT